MDNKTAATRAWVDCGHCADAFYSAMTVMTVSLRTEGAESVYLLAIKFDQSIDRFLDRLTALPAGETVDEYRRRGILYKSILAPDLDYLRTVSKTINPQTKSSQRVNA